MRQRAKKKCRPLIAITDQGELIYMLLKVNNIKVVPPVYEAFYFDPNQMYTPDKIVVKHISVKETLLKLDLEPKGQGHSNNRILSNRKKIFRLLINKARIRLVTVVQLMSQTDQLVRTEKGKQRSRIIRLIITTAGRFLENRTEINSTSNF